MSTIFQKIIDGEIPCFKVFENEHVLAFLDVAPLSKGHTLVIPKEPASSLHELSAESAAALGIALVQIAKAIVQVTGVSEYNVLQNNGETASQSVFHVHFHIIPKPNKADGLQLVWNTDECVEGAAFAEEIRNAL